MIFLSIEHGDGGEKKMDKILSVVIPSYNVEKYLEQTLESFIDECILKDVEILVVDDGSKDRTAEIAFRYQERYPDTVRLISKENGGHGSTINRGIEECYGKYFKVVDGDDWVQTEDFVKLVKVLEQCSSDYVVTNYYEVNDFTKEKKPVTFQYMKQSQELLFNDIALKGILPMHALCVKTEILKKHRIRLDEKCFYVDVEYILYPIPYVNTVCYFDLYVYMYRLAMATQSVSITGFQKHVQNHKDVILHLADFYDEYSKKEGNMIKKQYISNRIAEMVGHQVTIFLSFKENKEKIKKDFIDFDQELKRRNKEIYDLAVKHRKALGLLRKTNFVGYGVITFLSNLKNR